VQCAVTAIHGKNDISFAFLFCLSLTAAEVKVGK